MFCCAEGVVLTLALRKRISLMRRAEDDKYTEDARVIAIRSSREKLFNSLHDWLDALETFFPDLRREVQEVDFDHPENTVLPIPSRLSKAKQDKYGLQHAAEVELEFRKIQAYALLTQCRAVVFDQEAGYKCKDQVTGQRENTRFTRLVASFQLNKTCAMGTYNQVRQMLLNLLGDEKHIPEFKKLEEKHMYCRHLQNSITPGASESDKQTNWLWQVQKPGGMSEAQDLLWQIESGCVFTSPFQRTDRLLPSAPGKLDERQSGRR